MILSVGFRTEGEDVVTLESWHRELAERRQAVWRIAQAAECDLALIYGGWGHAEPFRYLTNFTPVLGDAYAILASAEQIACVLNFSWQLIEARAISGLPDWYGIFNTTPKVLELLGSMNAAPRRIGLVGLHRLPHPVYEAIQAAFPNAVLIDLGAEVGKLRWRKTDFEISLLREAGRITDAALDWARANMKPGMTEFEVAANLNYVMQSTGAELSFSPTVISGNDKPIPIRMPTDRKLQAGDTVMIDIGAMYQGYQADASRTYVLGEPNADQQKVWDIIQRAYDATFAQIRPGVPCRELHRAAVAVIEGEGYQLVHRIGHGIGLSTSFEYPSLDTETAPLEAGMTFCIEPGIYVAGAGNMKLEDDVVVTADGYALLTHSARHLAV
jgi:Xaa-Pro dipeptidase